MFVTAILAWGTNLSAKVSLAITVTKVAVVLLVVVVGSFYINMENYYINMENYTPFVRRLRPARAAPGLNNPRSRC